MPLSVLRQTRPPAGGLHDPASPGNGDGDAAPGRGRPGPGRGRGWAALGFGGRDGANGNGSDPRRTIPVRPNAQVAARVGLWALVALGAIGGLVGLLRPTTETAAPSDDGAAGDVTPPEVAGFGELAVTTWIEAEGDGAEAQLDALFAVNPPSSAGDAGRRRVNGDAIAIGTREVSDEYWAVTVVAPVDELVQGAWEPVGNWYVEVGIARTGDGLVAVSEPAIVPAPGEPNDAPEPAGEGLGVPAEEDEEMATTVEGFLSALLAGDGDVSRYLAPDTVILPVTPAPFRDVTLGRWAVTDTGDDTVRVRLSAQATSPAGGPRTVSYELGLAERAGRWEVTSLSGAPTIDPDESSPAPGASSSTSSPDATSAPGATSPTSGSEVEVTSTVSIASEPGA